MLDAMVGAIGGHLLDYLMDRHATHVARALLVVIAGSDDVLSPTSKKKGATAAAAAAAAAAGADAADGEGSAAATAALAAAAGNKQVGWWRRTHTQYAQHVLLCLLCLIRHGDQPYPASCLKEVAVANISAAVAGVPLCARRAAGKAAKSIWQCRQRRCQQDDTLPKPAATLCQDVASARPAGYGNTGQGHIRWTVPASHAACCLCRRVRRVS
jgi:hypothetical protein